MAALGTGAVDLNLSSPIASSFGEALCVDSVLTGDLSGSVTSGYPPYTFNIVSSVGGSANVDPNSGAFTFTAATGFSGDGGFEYQVIDSLGCSGVGFVDISVSAPIAGNTGINDCVNTNATGDLSSLVTSGFPPYTFSATGTPVNGAVTVNPNGTFTFTPTVGFSGVGGFVYEVTDELGCIGTGAVTVTIASPVASNTAVRDCVNGSVSGSLSSLVTGGFPPYVFSETGPVVGGTVALVQAVILIIRQQPDLVAWVVLTIKQLIAIIVLQVPV